MTDFHIPVSDGLSRRLPARMFVLPPPAEESTPRRIRRPRCSSRGSRRPTRVRAIYLTRGGTEPLLCRRKFFLAFHEFSLDCGELSGVLVQLLPRLSQLRFLTLNRLIFRLKLF